MQRWSDGFPEGGRRKDDTCVKAALANLFLTKYRHGSVRRPALGHKPKCSGSEMRTVKQVSILAGGPCRNRTSDHLIKSQVSLQPKKTQREKSQGKRRKNPR